MVKTMYEVKIMKSAQKDKEKIKKIPALRRKSEQLIEIIEANPFQNPPPYEKLVGDLSGLYPRRINIKHRLVYQVYEDEKTIKILSLWTHYEY